MTGASSAPEGSGITFGSLFAGIGGFDLGLERAGMKCRWQVEIDPFCRGVLARHWPDVPRYEDIRDVGIRNLSEVTLICGGFPCQPISRAGRQRAHEDSRWLWPEFFRVVDEVRPRFVFVENVSSLTRYGLGDILRDLSSLGYDAEWESITAAYFGAPHERERLYLLAYADGLGCKTSYLRPDSVVPHAEWHLAVQEERRTYQQHWAREPVHKTIEPEMGELVDGVPHKMAIRALGNAVVPQIVEWIGRRIVTEVGR